MTNAQRGGAKPRKIIILGALSAIAEAAARIWASEGSKLILAGRNAERLETVTTDLRARGGLAEIVVADLAVVDAELALRQMVAQLGGVDVVLLAYGILGDQKLVESDIAAAQRSLAINFTSAASWCLAAANVLAAQGRGTLVVIGSVAGDRGRASNYVYGAAKGGLCILVQGIAHRLARVGARAVLIKPGFVDTPMTAAFANKGLLWSQPDDIAKVIVQAAADDRHTRPIIYAPWFWRWIMYVIRFVPSAIFDRMNL